MIVTLTDAKKHLNIDEYFVDDDEYISELITDCEGIVSEQACVDISSLDGTALRTAKRAVLLLVGDYYAQRESTVIGASVNAHPLGFDRLCNLIRNYAR